MQQMKAERGADGIVRTQWKFMGPTENVRSVPSSRVLRGVLFATEGSGDREYDTND